jgi:hypothetical protein
LKYEALQKKRELGHQTRTQDLEYAKMFKEHYGVSKPVMIGGTLGIAALIGYFMLS